MINAQAQPSYYFDGIDNGYNNNYEPIPEYTCLFIFSKIYNIYITFSICMLKFYKPLIICSIISFVIIFYPYDSYLI
jgi:hypothetical protein